MNRFSDDLLHMDETMLKQTFRHWMEPHFNMQWEVKGRHLIEGKTVYADILLTPKQHLLSAGFEDMTIVVEVKAMGDKVDKLARAMWQTATYVQSEFDGVRPRMGAIFPYPQSVWGYDGLSDEGGQLLDTRRSLLNLMFWANVGYFKDTERGWKLNVGTQSYFTFDARYGLKRSPHNLLRRCVGNF